MNNISEKRCDNCRHINEESQEVTKSAFSRVIRIVISILAILFLIASIIFVLINVIAHLITGVTIKTLIEATSALEITMLFSIFIWKIVKHLKESIGDYHK